MRLRLTLLFLLGCALCARTQAEARWEDLSSGMNEEEVSQALGTPLIVNEGRGYTQWTYDAGGSVMFHHRKVSFWGTPRGHKPAPKAPTPKTVATLSPVTAPAPVADSIATPASAPTASAHPGPAPDVPHPAAPPLRNPKVEVRVPSFAELTRS